MDSADIARWRRVRDIFDEVVDLDAEARGARLAAVCGDDDVLRREVESLIAHDRSGIDPIGEAVAGAARGAADAAVITGPGQTLLHYRLTEPIGHGGMGVVWKAVDETLGRDVAIKVLPPGVGDDPRRLARFEREAKLLASLNHTNIAAIFSLHAVNGVRFLAMEFVPGDDLAARLKRGPVPLPDALRIGRQIAEALEEAHEKGVVHRDLKPANVKVTREGRVKVLDFGLAKAFAADPGLHSDSETSSHGALAVDSTREGVILGTAAYMPPEQARGSGVDKRADIWAFGVLMFEMLSGVRPFTGGAVVDLLAAVLTAEPDWSKLPAETPASLVALLRRCLQKDARQRLRDIGDARIELEQLVGGASDSGTVRAAVPLPAAPTPVARRRRWRDAGLVAGGAVAAAAIVVAGLLWTSRRPADGVATRQARLNVAMAPGTVLEDVIGAGRQALSLSRDGGTVVFVGREADGRRQIYVRRLDRVGAEAVAGTAGGDMPFLSPDGRWLGFAADGKLKRVAIGGGQPLIICDAPEPRGASWGDDDTIVFAAGPRSPLSRVSAAGGTPTTITTIDTSRGEVGHRWPVVLAGMRGVVFNAESSKDIDADRTVEVLDLTAGRRRTLARGATYPRIAGDVLLYATAGTLFAAPFDLTRLEATAPAVPVVEDVRMDPLSTGRAFVDIAPDGTLVYVPGFPRPGARTLAWADRRGRLTPVTTESRAYRGARLSPDGRQVAVTTLDGTSTLWIFDLARTTWNGVATAAEITTPAWSPDGRQVLFSANPPDGAGIYQTPADASGRVEPFYVPGTGIVDMPAVSPDGRLVYVARQNQESDDVYAVSTAPPHAATPVLTGPGGEVSPEVSASGRFLAYSSNETGRREVYVRAARGDGPKWTVSTSGGTTPRWRRDERELFYVEGTRLMAVDIDVTRGFAAGAPHLLFDSPALAWSDVDLTRYDVTADGQRFLLVMPEPREIAPLQIVVAPNFAAELAARLRR